MDTKMYRTSIKEEMFNVITHALGIGLSIAGLGILVVSAIRFGDVWHIVSFSIYGVSLIFLYTASTIFHSLLKVRPKFYANIVDHSAVYILIAGTYTPFTLITLRGSWGWTIFGIVWGLAILGVTYKIFMNTKYRVLSTIVYLLMGWVIIIAVKPLYDNLASGGLWLLALGGLSYSIGVVFYTFRKIPWGHGIWHIFVLLGSVLHFFSVYLYLLPGN
ncbi:MAG TPA: hemolysin D [Bacteroidales bacterium]|nr:hemolysin D [Bacteroidales bacterium]